MSWSDRFKRVKLVAFSLRVQMHTYPPAVALRLLSPVPPSSERPTLSSFIDPPPPFPSHPHPPPPTLCAQVWTFYIYFSGTDMEHLRGRRGCCGTAWTAWILPTGKCVFTTCERVFFFSTHSRCDFFFFPLSQDCKNHQKNHVTRLLSFIFVLFTFLLETIMFVMVTSNGKLHTVF